MPRTLIASLLGWCLLSPLNAASDGARDQQAVQVGLLIEAGMRASARRALDSFAAAHPTARDHLAVLGQAFAERFRHVGPENDRRRLADEAARLRPAAEAAAPAVRRLLLGDDGTRVLRLANAVLRVLDHDAPARPLPSERAALVQADVAALAAAVRAQQAAATAALAAGAPDDQRWRDLDPGDRRFAELGERAVARRLAALRPLHLAQRALREVVGRGGEAGVDAEPARAALIGLLREHRDLLASCDEFADWHPGLRSWLAALAGEAARLGSGAASEAERQFRLVLDLDPAEAGAARAAVLDCQLQTWVALLRWRLDCAAGPGGATALASGRAEAQELADRLREQPGLDLASRDAGRARVLGQAWLLAGRLALAAGDRDGARARFQAVIAAGNAMAAHARDWLLAADQRAPRWGDQPQREEPAFAHRRAGALGQRGDDLAAAAALREGILGLDALRGDQARRVTAEIYRAYAATLARCRLPWQATLVANDGLQRVAALSANGADAAGDDDAVGALAAQAVTVASALDRGAGGGAGRALRSQVHELAHRLAPRAVGALHPRLWPEPDPASAPALLAALARAGDPATQEDAAAALDRVAAWRRSLAGLLRARGDADGARRQLDALLADARGVADGTPADPAARPGRVLAATAAEAGVRADRGDHAGALALLTPALLAAPADARAGALAQQLAQALHADARARWQEHGGDAEAMRTAWPASERAFATLAGRLPALPEGATRRNAQRLTAAAAALTAAHAERLSAAGAGDLAGPGRAARRLHVALAMPAADAPVADLLALAASHQALGADAEAAPLLDRARARVFADPDLAAYVADAAATVDRIAQPLLARREMQQAWLAGDGARAALLGSGGGYRDAVLARSRLAALATLVDEQRPYLAAAAFTGLGAAVARLDALAGNLAEGLALNARLARLWRAAGDARALPLWRALAAAAPDDDEYALGAVDGVIAAHTTPHREVPPPTRADLAAARDAAAAVLRRSARPGHRWLAFVQCLELSQVLGDTDLIRQQLASRARDQASPASDLAAPPRPGDPPLLHRLPDAEAVRIVERFLALHRLAPGLAPAHRLERRADGVVAVPAGGR